MVTDRSGKSGGTNSRPVQYTSLSISAGGVRVRAEGRTGPAWRVLRRRYPVLGWLALLYVVLLVTAIGLFVWGLVGLR